MDAPRFDALTKLLAGAHSRRSMLRGSAGVLLGTMMAPAIQGEAKTQPSGLPAAWSVTAYGDNSTTIVPADINNQGVVVATRQDPDGFRPVRLEDGRITVLGDGSVDGFASAINDVGTVVGTNEYSDDRRVAAVYSEGATTELQAGSAYDVDNAGTIVGEVNSVPAYWPQGGPPLALPVLIEGRPAYVAAINEQGWMVGDAVGPHWNRSDRLADHAVLWRDGQIIDLGSVADGNTVAVDVTDTGIVIGFTIVSPDSGTESEGPDYLPFTWQDDRIEPLPMPDGERSCYASAINELGWIVGNCGKGMSGQYGVMWVAGDVVELNTLLGPGWQSLIATGVNDRGQIVGQAIQGGQVRGYVLTPEW